jgi:hypothetical protein
MKDDAWRKVVPVFRKAKVQQDMNDDDDFQPLKLNRKSLGDHDVFSIAKRI